MFADDTLLLGTASVEEAITIKGILNTYESWSGQLVSPQKSTIVFSPNVEEHTRREIYTILGMLVVDNHGKYLGLPSTIGTSKKEVFNSIVNRVKTKVDNWKSRLLSKEGTWSWIQKSTSIQPSNTMCLAKLHLEKTPINQGPGVSMSKIAVRLIVRLSYRYHWTSWTKEIFRYGHMIKRNWNRLPRLDFKKWIVYLWETWHQRNGKVRGQQIRMPYEVVRFGAIYLTNHSSAVEDLHALQPP
ncbi:hypothetical protein LIER_38476 [Lithospermum erythrorhizon]|uniref:Reverse transcriptase domain-containing protein n=1 Tax=Lithospermum erythrorhizon TaxID=34254 RepID=A0AAV3Q5P8_LITER